MIDSHDDSVFVFNIDIPLEDTPLVLVPVCFYSTVINI